MVLTHLDEKGAARMVDVSEKASTVGWRWLRLTLLCCHKL
jgi:molybdenum cofactor biosynthesis enzyme